MSLKTTLTALFLLTAGVVNGQVFDSNTIQRFDIYFAQDNWDEILDSLKATTDGYLMTDSVVINGTLLDSAGAKYKGNSSYNADAKKNSFTLDLDKFKDQEYEGLTKYKLHNLYLDPSMIREPLAYQILREYMIAPRANFAEVYVNGVYHGLYSNTEDLSKDFVKERFASSKSNAFIKCSPVITPGPNVKSNLRYISDDSSAYENYYELESDTGWNEVVRVCDVVTNDPMNMDSTLNLNAVLWMLAFDHAILNLDSYIGAFSQNYLLFKENNGQFTPICWDMNMTFGGFPFIGSSNTSLGALSIDQLKTLPTSAHQNDEWWPLIKAIHANPTWKRMYLAHLRTITREQLTSGAYATLATSMHNLVEGSVLADTNKLYTNDDFVNSFTTDVNVGAYSVPGIVSLMTDRTTYLENTPELAAVPPAINAPKIAEGSEMGQVSISVAVTGAGVSNVYCFVRPDSTSLYEQVALFDDGAHADGAAGDGTYGASISAEDGVTHYYLYAENNEAGVFSPARAGRVYHTVSITTSVSEDDEHTGMAPYPNPATDAIMLPTASLGGRIIDVSGAVVVEHVTSTPFRVSNLLPGMYRVVKGAHSWTFVVVR